MNPDQAIIDVLRADLIPVEAFVDATLDYLDFLKFKPCAVQGSDCWGDVVPAHLVTVGTGNTRKKLSLRHLSAVPLCAGHHLEQEGETTAFNKTHDTDLALYALQLNIEFFTGREACWHNDR